MRNNTLFMVSSARRPLPTRVRETTILLLSILLVATVVLSSNAAAASKRTRIVETACGSYDVVKDLEASITRGDPALGESILGAVIQNTLGRIGAALRAAGEASTASTVVHRNIEVEPGKPVKCLFVVRGYWGATAKNAFKYDLDSKTKDLAYVLSDGSKELLRENPDFALQLAIAKSSDHSALKLEPVTLEYGRHLVGKKRGSRGLSVEVAFHAPGQASDDKDAVGTSLVIGDFEPGHRYDLKTGSMEEWDRKKKVWKMVSATKLPLQEESHWFPTYSPKPVKGADKSANTQKTPKIISVTVAETRAARPMLLFFADVFDASKKDIQASLESKLLESRIEEAQTTAAKAKNDQLVEFVTAVADANIAIAEYCDLGNGRTAADYLKARKKMFVAMNSANFIASGLAQPLPFSVVPEPAAETPGKSGLCP